MKMYPVLSTTSWRRMGEWRYNSTHFKPRPLMNVSFQLHVPATLPPAIEHPISNG